MDYTNFFHKFGLIWFFKSFFLFFFKFKLWRVQRSPAGKTLRSYSSILDDLIIGLTANQENANLSRDSTHPTVGSYTRRITLAYITSGVLRLNRQFFRRDLRTKLCPNASRILTVSTSSRLFSRTWADSLLPSLCSAAVFCASNFVSSFVTHLPVNITSWCQKNPHLN